ncbi:MAG TPA: class I SAM-dependent methyltransferase [Methylomirabilota bacterium]|jgi:SAM-dependent methyltransferase|nr:class I SAM-dependent methyltransferase [Methylomirabilota bacterium]
MIEKPYRAAVCNICESDKFRTVRYFAEWNYAREPVKDVTIIQCRRCKIRRRMPEIVDDYEADYHAAYVEQKLAIHPHQLSHFADLMTARLRQFEQADVKFLDVGCSTGRVLRLATTMGFDATGLDLSHWAVEYCNKLGFKARQGSLVGQWKEGERFDVIHCSHTIEHVPDPVAYLKEIHRLIKSGGHLMLACPNYASLPRLALGDRWIWFLDSHLWQFTARQIRRLVVSCGFKIISCRTLHGLSPAKRWKKRLLDVSASIGFGDGLNLIAARP